MFSAYIPTSSLFSSNNLEQYRDSSVVQMKVGVFDLSGNPYAVKGVSEFTVQNNPATLETPEIKADYASHTGLGRVQEQIHYLNTTQGTVPFSLYIVDSYEGPPHATIKADGSIERTNFNNLMEVSNWFAGLLSPPAEWGKAPFVRVGLGRYSVFGVMLTAKTEWLKLQPNGEETIGRIDFTVKPDIIDASQDSAFFLL
jgi:hypothetical protein